MDDPSVCSVDLPDRRLIEIPLFYGGDLVTKATPCGLVEAWDFFDAEGGIQRLEKRIVEVMPGISVHDRRIPVLDGDSIERRREENALFRARWNGFSRRKRLTFLRKCVAPSEILAVADEIRGAA